MSPDETIAATDGLLVLKECPSCDYSLIGLPRKGTCPECGKPYAQGTVILRGWGRGSKASLRTAPPRLTMLMALPWVVAGFGAAASLRYRSSGRVLSSAIGYLFLVGSVALTLLWRTRWLASRPPVEVRLNAVGCSQTIGPRRDAHGDATHTLLKVLTNSLTFCSLMILFADGDYRLTVLFFAVLFVAAFLWWRVSRKRRLEMARRRSPAQSALFAHEAATTHAIWNDVSDVRFNSISRGRWRLRIGEGERWIKVDALDFEFQADAAQVEELRLQIERWREAVRPPPPPPLSAFL